MNVLAIISLLASLIGSGVSAKQKRDVAQRQEKYQKDYAAVTEKERKESIQQQNKEARKAAISRAIGSDLVYMPAMRKTNYDYPDMPSTPRWDVGGVIQGVGGALGQLGDIGGGSNISASEPRAERTSDFLGRPKNTPVYNPETNSIKWKV